MPNSGRKMVESLVDAAWRIEREQPWRNVVGFAYPYQRAVWVHERMDKPRVFTASADTTTDHTAATPAQPIVEEFTRCFVFDERHLKAGVGVVFHVRVLLHRIELMPPTVVRLKDVD
ncbi:hypothetical protein E3G67_003680 [Mycobacteroides abscessus]|nr:hypothetical protein [Mycobacteroides abscessus]